jgi:hypothetical protein
MRREGRYDSGARSLFAAVITLAAMTGPLATGLSAADERRADVKAVVTRFYPHGIPYSEAKALGTAAIPELVSILRDPAMEEHWTKAVWVLGCIGDSSATGPLVEFLERPRGEVSVNGFRAARAVLPALGHVARGGDAGALQALARYTRADSGEARVALAYGRYKGAVMSEVLARTAIQGLGIAGTPEALAILESMNRPDLRPDWQDNVKEALALNLKVARLGPERAFAQEEER